MYFVFQCTFSLILWCSSGRNGPQQPQTMESLTWPSFSLHLLVKMVQIPMSEYHIHETFSSPVLLCTYEKSMRERWWENTVCFYIICGLEILDRHWTLSGLLLLSIKLNHCLLRRSKLFSLERMTILVFSLTSEMKQPAFIFLACDIPNTSLSAI